MASQQTSGQSQRPWLRFGVAKTLSVSCSTSMLAAHVIDYTSAEHLSDYQIEGRLKTEFNPPAALGPIWDDSHQLLDHVPAVQALLRECFLEQKERVGAVDLRDRFGAIEF